MTLSKDQAELLALLLAEEGLELEPERSIRRLEQRDDLPLSYAQQRLWFLAQLLPGDPSYNISTNVRLQGDLRVDILERCFNEVVRRHEALRTRFHSVGGQPRQVIEPQLAIPLVTVDLRHLPPEERGEEVSRLFRKEAQQAFDLVRDPLIRTTLLQLAEDEHVLLLTIQHIVSDGWSMGVFLQEVGVLYEAFLQGRPSPLPELEIQYADFANWQHETLQGEVLAGHLDFWKKLLHGDLPVLELPTDRPRPKVKSGKGHLKKFVIPQRLLDRLTELGAEQQASLYMTLLAAFNVLLSRYTGQEDILVGAPIANRNRRELEGLIGFLANTVVFRTDLSGEPTFRELLNRVRDVANGVYAHQDLPFVKLVEAIQPDRNLGNTPLFQVFFVLQNAPMPAMKLPGLTLSLMEMESATAKFDLSIYILEENGSQVGMLEYNTDLYDHETIDRMIAQFLTLLEGIAVHPDLTVSTLPLLPEAEERQIVQDFSHGPQTGVEDVCIHELFERQVARTPDSTALVFEGETLTYRDLNARANRLAHYLRNHGIGRDQLVGLALERSVEMVVALLGVLKAGGAYLPLDPHHPVDRLTFITEETGINILLTQTRFLHTLPQQGPALIDLDSETFVEESETNPVSGVTPDDLAYVIYTSGSTGQPKGVLVPHYGVVNRLLWGQATYPLDGTDRVLQKTPYTFDVSVWEFFWPLLAGSTLVVAKPDGHQDPSYLVELIQSQAITITHFVPSMLQVFLDEKNVRACTSLRHVICSGEALPYELQERFFNRLGAELHNLYGPTETSIEVTYWDCDPDSTRRAVPIGYPIANVETYVFDRHLRPVPIGVPGELYLGGACVTRGYNKRPELTEKAFIPHPFPKGDGERLYKTGDLVRYLPDGAIEYISRIDHQVKIRGFRIELGEIEGALAQHSAIREAVVIAREDEPGDKRLVAYLVPVTGQVVPTASELRQYLTDRLPAYMIPSFFVALDSLPLTSSGKTDRKALPAPTIQRIAFEREYVAPRDHREEELVQIWRDLLDVEEIGVHDNFFDLGGHSLKATQLVAQVSNAYGVSIPLGRLFEDPTVAGLAEMIAAGEGHAQHGGEQPIQPLARTEASPAFPASFAQERLWFFDQFEPGNASYNVPNLIRLRGQLDFRALQDSLTEIVRRHESLRTTFEMVEGVLLQRIAPPSAQELRCVDLTDRPRHEREETAYRHADLEAKTGFDLASGPLFRPTLYRLLDDEHWLMLNLHHIITDGWSMGNLFHELATLYHAFSQGKPSPLPELFLQYADFADWHANWLSGDHLTGQLDYWRAQLAGELPVLHLPTDRPRPAVQTYNGRLHVFELPVDLRERLQALSREEDATLFMTLLAAFNAWLHTLTGQQDVNVGTPIAGRTRSDLKEIIGLFVNTLVLRSDLGGDPTFRDLMRSAKATALDAYQHQDVPLDRLIEELQPERDLSRTPLFQALFVLQNAPLDVLELPALTMSYIETDSGAAGFDLTLSMKETAQGLYGKLIYNTDLFDDSTIEKWARQFRTILQTVVAEPDLPLADLVQRSGADTSRWHQATAASRTPQAALRTEHAAPRTPLEAEVLAAMTDLLGFGGFGIHDNFFELGGHSLMATRIVSRLRAAHGVDVPLRRLFQRPTAAGIAETITAMRRDEEARAVPIPSVSPDGPQPFSFAQERMWPVLQRIGGIGLFNMPMAARLTGELDASVLEAAFNEIVRRHDVLRARFTQGEEGPIQSIAPFEPIRIEQIDLRHLPLEQREAEAHRLLVPLSEVPFDLAKGPLIRFHLVRLDDGEHILLCVVHHIAADGWSLGVLFQEFVALYSAYVEGRPSPFLPLAVRYADYAVWEREYLQGDRLERQLDFWKQRLADAPESLLPLPLDRLRPDAPTFNGASVAVTLPPAVLTLLQEMSRRQGATLYMTVAAALQTVLHRISGASRISIGTPVAGRARTEWESLIGLFMNTIVLHTDFDGIPTFADLLARVRDYTLGAYDAAEAPLVLVGEALQRRTPFYNVLYAHQNVPLADLQLPGIALSSCHLDTTLAKSDLSFTTWEEAAGLGLSLVYNTDLFDRSTARAILHRLTRFLEQAARDPHQPLEEI
ncbi:amino acid adenylation domain-containing protein [Tumebacillus sp. DT12]|uniref:Amino acid adenylation domain-containing protein n=1 Tax=Tumebacillus lacus TaxID=2995335 RepID=A0ABT3WVU7_9BACL|nr:non-ribosomal peptide synthetase [Tumebacillus lacus]MCX7568802.1 amino acid adenylation domain-containing protein [Tumebacillus lacus]